MNSATDPRRIAFPFVKQEHARDCGYACLRMIIRYYGGDFEFADPAYRARLSPRGVDLLTLTQIAKGRGLRCTVMRGTFEEFTNDLCLPCIIHWQQNHFMVVCEVTADTIVVANPARGFEVLSYDDFRQGWATAGAEDAGDGGAVEGIVLRVHGPRGP